MLYNKLALLTLLSLLLFSCVSGGKQKEPKTVEQLNEEGQLLGRMLTYFMENNFDFRKLESLSDVERHEENYTVDGSGGGSAEIVIKSTSVVDGVKKVYKFNFEVTFNNYSYEGLTFNSGSLNFNAEANLIVDDEGQESPTRLLMSLVGELEYTGTASGSAELKLSSELSYNGESSIPSSEEEEKFLIIDGAEVETKDIEFFN